MQYTFIISVCLLRFSFVDSYHGDVHNHLTSEKFNNHVSELKSDNGCSDVLMCMEIEMLTNISKIVSEDEYNLTENLILERTPGSKIEAVISEKELQTLKDPGKTDYGYVTALLMKKTLDIFRSHTMKWTPIPGLDIRIFQQNGGSMDVAFEMTNRGKNFNIYSHILFPHNSSVNLSLIKLHC